MSKNDFITRWRMNLKLISFDDRPTKSFEKGYEHSKKKKRFRWMTAKRDTFLISLMSVRG